MKSFRLILVAAIIQFTLFSVPPKAPAQEASFDYSGARVNTEAQTLYILFKDGSLLFTFINPPEMSIPDWHIRGVWAPDGTSGVELKYPFRLSEKEKYSRRTEKLRLLEGELLSLEHGSVYVRVEESKGKLRVKPYEGLEKSVPFKAPAQEASFDYSGAWLNSEAQTLCILFKDGNSLFTFINPPEKSIPDWHIRGVWSPVTTSGVELRYPFKSAENGKYNQQIEKLRLLEGELLSLEHGSVYVRIEENKDKLRVKPYKELEK